MQSLSKPRFRLHFYFWENTRIKIELRRLHPTDTDSESVSNETAIETLKKRTSHHMQENPFYFGIGQKFICLTWFPTLSTPPMGSLGCRAWISFIERLSQSSVVRDTYKLRIHTIIIK